MQSLYCFLLLDPSWLRVGEIVLIEDLAFDGRLVPAKVFLINSASYGLVRKCGLLRCIT